MDLDKEFLEYLEIKELSPNTITTYFHYFKKFFKKYKVFKQREVNNFLMRKENRNSGARSTMNVIKRFYIYNQEKFKISDEKLEKIKAIFIEKRTGRKKARRINPLSEEEIFKLCDNLETEKEKVMCLLSYYGGLRIAELFNIRVNSFDWEKWKRENYETKIELSIIGKGNKERMVFIPSEVAKKVARYRFNNLREIGHDQNFLFVHNKKEFIIKNVGSIWQKKLKKAGIKAGLTKFDEQGNLIKGTQTNPHRLRHSFAGMLMRKGKNLRVIQEALGHADLSTVQVYTHLAESDIKKELEDIDYPKQNI